MDLITPCQETAFKEIQAFLLNQQKHFHIIQGEPGVGKTTLVSYILGQLENIKRASKLIGDNPIQHLENLVLIAPTHKAVTNLNEAVESGLREQGLLVNDLFSQVIVGTAHSVMGLRIGTDYSTGKKKLHYIENNLKLEPEVFFNKSLVIFDEAYYPEASLIKHLFNLFSKHHSSKPNTVFKSIFLGDPTQLVQHNGEPYLNNVKKSFEKSVLTTPVRFNSNSDINNFAMALRKTIRGDEYVHPELKYGDIEVLDRDAFVAEYLNHFQNNPTSNSKILAYRNNTVQAYNNHVYQMLHPSNTRKYLKGERLVSNHQVTSICTVNLHGKKAVVLNNETVELFDDAVPDSIKFKLLDGSTAVIQGHVFTLANNRKFFMPDNKLTIKPKDLHPNVREVLSRLLIDAMADFRYSYASTVDKSQGSTFDTVFLDISDISTCHNTDRLLRLLHTGVTRASKRLVITE